MSQNNPKGFLKISELARAANISLSTLKYYVHEGLVEIAMKTGKNMAYYAPESVERVKLIRAMQSEKYYPLSVIKRLLQGDGADAGEALLLDTISKADQGDYYQAVPLSDAISQSGLKSGEAEALIRGRLITATRQGKTRTCSRGDLRVMSLAKRRLEAGIPLGQTIKTFQMYQESLEASTKKDISSLLQDAMLSKTLDTVDIVRMINVSDETLDSFISMKRYAMNAAEGEWYISKIELMQRRLQSFGAGVCKIFKEQGQANMAAELDVAIKGGRHSDGVVAEYCTLLQLSDLGIAQSLRELHKAAKTFAKPPALCENPSLEKCRRALKLGWCCFVPEELGVNKPEALEDFRRDCGDEQFTLSILGLLDELRGRNK